MCRKEIPAYGHRAARQARHDQRETAEVSVRDILRMATQRLRSLTAR